MSAQKPSTDIYVLVVKGGEHVFRYPAETDPDRFFTDAYSKLAPGQPVRADDAYFTLADQKNNEPWNQIKIYKNKARDPDGHTTLQMKCFRPPRPNAKGELVPSKYLYIDFYPGGTASQPEASHMCSSRCSASE